MLCGIKIKNFKSIADEQRLNNLGLLNTLTGSNNSGKTAVLEAILLFSDVLKVNSNDVHRWFAKGNNINIGNNLTEIIKLNPKTKIPDLFYNKDYRNLIEIEFSFKIDGSLSNFFKKEVNPSLEGIFLKEIVDLDILRIQIILNGEKADLGSISWGNLKLTSADNSGNLLDVTRYLRNSSAQKNYNVSYNLVPYQGFFIPALAKSLQEFTVLYIHSKRKIEPIVYIDDKNADSRGTLLKKELFRLYHGNLVENAKYDKILRMFSEVTGKSINDRPFYNKDQNYVDIVFKEGDVLVDIDASGYGYYQLLNIIYNVVFYESNIILIDEPEISLHPQAQINLFVAIKNIVKAEKKQFFIATHSPYFIDLSYIDSIFKFTKNGKATSIFQINSETSVEDQKKLNKISSGKDMALNSKCRELLFFDEVIFVEGPDDFEFFLKLIDEEKIVIRRPLDRFLEIGGYRQERVNKLAVFCKKFNIKYKFFFDFDYYLYNSQIERLINALKQIEGYDQDFLRMLEDFTKMDWKEKKKYKSEIEEKWHSLYLKYWEDKNIINLLNQEKQENIYILPAMDIDVIADEMGSNESLKKIVIQLFVDNFTDVI